MAKMLRLGVFLTPRSYRDIQAIRDDDPNSQTSYSRNYRECKYVTAKDKTGTQLSDAKMAYMVRGSGLMNPNIFM